MDEKEFKIRLAEVLGEPAAPDALVENTVRRVKIAERSRAAEQCLRDGQAPPGERVSLLADSLLGRLARSGTLPLGADTGALKRQLLENQRFGLLAQQDPDKVLDGWDKGKLSGQMLKAPAPAKTVPRKGGPALGPK